MFKLKFILVTAVLLLGASGVAAAATGNLPEAVKSLMGSSIDSSVTGDQDTGRENSAAEDQYPGGGVSAIARDKSAMGTMTLPNGKVIENHGMAVSQAAHAQYHDDENTDPSQPGGNMAPPQPRNQQGEDNSGNQAQAHEIRGNGTSSSMPTVPESRGGKHGKP